ncbi:MAG: ParA family protein [Actinobacteria bacterium]|nr:ParA family protein [Actinomycetota bacterium]
MTPAQSGRSAELQSEAREAGSPRQPTEPSETAVAVDHDVAPGRSGSPETAPDPREAEPRLPLERTASTPPTGTTPDVATGAQTPAPAGRDDRGDEAVRNAPDPVPSPSSSPRERAILDPGTWGADQARALTRRDVLRPGGGPEVRDPARVLAFANQKGGVGKTTTVISLGAALAELGSRVLLVDMDPQGSLGVGLGLEPHQLQSTIYNLLMQDGSHPDDVIAGSGIDGMHVLPANIDLAAAELALVQEVAREQALRRVIDRVRFRYDFILIDCPPSLGLLTINGLTAADRVIVPLECEYFALRGMSLLMDTIDKVRSRLNPELALEGIVATIFDGRTIHAREVLDRVRDAFGDVVFKTTINKTIRFAEAPVVGESILTYAPRSKGSDAYRDLAREVLSRESSS